MRNTKRVNVQNPYSTGCMVLRISILICLSFLSTYRRFCLYICSKRAFNVTINIWLFRFCRRFAHTVPITTRVTSHVLNSTQTHVQCCHTHVQCCHKQYVRQLKRLGRPCPSAECSLFTQLPDASDTLFTQRLRPRPTHSLTPLFFAAHKTRMTPVKTTIFAMTRIRFETSLFKGVFLSFILNKMEHIVFWCKAIRKCNSWYHKQYVVHETRVRQQTKHHKQKCHQSYKFTNTDFWYAFRLKRMFKFSRVPNERAKRPLAILLKD